MSIVIEAAVTERRKVHVLESESGPQLLAREDIDVSQEMRRILSSGGITNKLIRRYRKL